MFVPGRKTTRRIAIGHLSIGILALGSAIAAGAGPDEAQAAATSPTSRTSIERLGEGLFRVGNIRANVSKTSPSLRLPAQVNMQHGMIELVACSSGGKLHESLFLVDIEPYHLHLALLLLDLKPKGGVREQGDTRLPGGDKVVIYVDRDGRRRVEDYIWDRQRDAPMEHTPWVFAGSRLIEGAGYGADLTRTVITTYRDPYTVLDNPLPTGADDTVYEVNDRVTPAVGTTMTLVIQPWRETAAGPKTRNTTGGSE